MDFESVEKAWQSQKDSMVDTEALLGQVREKHRKLVRAIFWRDVREVAAAVLVAAFFFWCGMRRLGGWPFYVAAALILGLGLFILVDRVLQRRKERAFGETVRDGIERALHQVNHQIWLLENVFWWYLLPAIIAYALVMVHVVATVSSQRIVPHARTMRVIGGMIGIGIAAFCFVYLLNRWAVRKELIPRRDQLERIARELEEDK